MEWVGGLAELCVGSICYPSACGGVNHPRRKKRKQLMRASRISNKCVDRNINEESSVTFTVPKNSSFQTDTQ